MKNVIKGRLSEKPEIKKRDVNGKDMRVVNTTIYIYDPNGKERDNGMKEGIPCPIVAWEDNAEVLASKDKGEYITFVGQGRKMQRQVKVNDEYSTIDVLGYIINKIDATNALDKQMSAMLKDYTAGKITKLYDVED